MRPSTMALVVSIAFGLGVTSAAASPCSDEISKLEQAIQQDGNSPAAAPTGRQSIGAQLGYQPTPDSVRQAELASKEGVAAILNRAKAFDAEGNTKGCMDLVSTARLRLLQ
jgi:hypothetical protein